MRKSIELRTQEEYEAYLIDQLSKLRETIETEEVKNMQRQAELAQRRALQREKKAEAAERADRIAQLEDMLVAAQEEESRKLAERRVAADERQRVRQAEIERVRAVEQRKKEEARALQRELHEQTLLRHAKERAAEEEAERLRKESLEAALQQRLKAEQAAKAARNLKKAQDAAAKIERAAELRKQLILEQRKEFAKRHEAQAERMEVARRLQEQRAEEQRQQAASRRETIARAQAQLRAAEQQRKSSLLEREAFKDEGLQRRCAQMAEARRQRRLERDMEAAAAKERVNYTMEAVEDSLSKLDAQTADKAARAHFLQAAKEARIEQQRHLARTVSLQKHVLSNSMSRIHQDPQQSSLKVQLPPGIRNNLLRPELKQLFDQADPEGTGVVTLSSMRKALGSLEGDEFCGSPNCRRMQRMQTRLGSNSLPSLPTRAYGSSPVSPASNFGRTESRRPILPLTGAASHEKIKAALSHDDAMAAFARADPEGAGRLPIEQLDTVLAELKLDEAQLERIRKACEACANEGHLAATDFSSIVKGIAL